MPAIGPLFARIAQGLARGGSSGGGGLDGVLLGRNFDLKIEFDDAEWRRWQRRLPNGFRRGIAQGLNQGGKQVRTATDRAIRARRPLPRKVVLAGLDITPATVNRLEWVMTVSGRPPPIEQYGMRVSPGRGRRRKNAAVARAPVTVLVTRGQRVVVAGAFTDGARQRVFRRIPGGTRIKRLYGPSLPGTFRTPQVQKAWREKALEAVPRLIRRRLQFLIDRQFR